MQRIVDLGEKLLWHAMGVYLYVNIWLERMKHRSCVIGGIAGLAICPNSALLTNLTYLGAGALAGWFTGSILEDFHKK